MGDGADEALDREMNEWLEDSRDAWEGEEVCALCSKPIDNCSCNEHPREKR